MAKFNNSIQDDVKPNEEFFHLTKSITQPEGNKSAAYAGQAAEAGYKGEGALVEGIGKIFGESVKATDTVIKDVIQGRVQTGVDDLVAEERATLEAAKFGRPTKTASLLPDNGGEDKVPAQIDNLDQSIGALQSGYESGRYNHTYLKMKTDQMAQNLRETFGEGYRPYIDEQISATTGRNTANKYAESLMRDMNRAAAQQSAQQNKVISFVEDGVKQGIPGAAALMPRAQSGDLTMSETALKLGPGFALKRNLELDNLRLNNIKAAGGNVSDLEERRAGIRVAQITGDVWEGILSAKGMTSPAKIQEQLQQYQLNSTTPSGTDIIQMRQHLQVAENLAVSKARQFMRTPDAQGETPISRLGTDGDAKSERIIDNMVRKQFRDIGDQIGPSPALAVVNKSKWDARQQDYDTRLQSDKEWTTYLMAGAYMEKHMPKQWQDLAQTYFDNNQIKDKWDHAKKAAEADAIVQPAFRAGTAPPTTLTDVVTRTQQLSGRPGDAPRFNADDYKEITDIPKIITSKDPKSYEIARNVAYASFSPGNQNFLDKFNMETKNARGETVDGKHAIFKEMTTPEMTQAMFEMGKRDPAIWNHYINWTLNSFGNKLFTREILNLAEYTDDPTVKVTWNTDTHQFNVRPTGIVKPFDIRPGTEPITNEGRLQLVKESLDRLNGGLDNISHLAKTNPKIDVDSFLIGRLMAAGFDPRKTEGIPKKIIDAIITGRRAAEEGPQKGSQSPQDAPTSRKKENPPQGSGAPQIPHYGEADRPAPTISEWRTMLEGATPQDRPAVMPSGKWWGDQEAEQAGIYEPTKPKKKK